MKYFARQIADNGFVYFMEHAGFKARLMRAERLKDIGRAHNLPAGDPIPVFPIAALPGAPDEWVRAAGTYVCPVDPAWGLWFDFTMNDSMNTAVVLSVKGMNPITGQKIDSLGLEEYSDKCPVHNEPFTHGNMCEKCGYAWPPQNFVSMDSGSIWWDGFRTGDKVRQFFFTEDEKRDIASAVIGKENTVPAFGFAFYRPKQPRTAPKVITRSVTSSFNPFTTKLGSYKCGGVVKSAGLVWGQPVDTTTTISINHSGSGTTTMCSSNNVSGAEAVYASFAAPEASFTAAGEAVMDCCEVEEKTSGGIDLPVKEVAVGAGAEIAQNLVRDSLGVKGWQEEPAAIIRLYFCFESQFRDIVKKSGIKDLTPQKEGFLKGLPVG